WRIFCARMALIMLKHGPIFSPWVVRRRRISSERNRCENSREPGQRRALKGFNLCPVAAERSTSAGVGGGMSTPSFLIAKKALVTLAETLSNEMLQIAHISPQL